MPELTRELFVALWQHAKSGDMADDADLSVMQKFMLMHEEMHEHFERIAADPGCSMEVEGENLMLRIAMDAAVQKSLETDQPEGSRNLMQGMLDAGLNPGTAFNVMSQAMMHSFIIAAGEEREMEPGEYLLRAVEYARQAIAAANTQA